MVIANYRLKLAPRFACFTAVLIIALVFLLAPVRSAHALPENVFDLLGGREYKEHTSEDLEILRAKLSKELESLMHDRELLGIGEDGIITDSEPDYIKAQGLIERITEIEVDLSAIENELWYRENATQLLAASVAIVVIIAIVVFFVIAFKRLKRKQGTTALQTMMDTGRGPMPGGVVTRQDVLRMYGNPRNRIQFSRLEAWTYLFSRQQLDSPADQPTKSESKVENRIFLFDGDLLYDYSIQIVEEEGF